MNNIYLNLFIVTVDVKTERRYILSKCKEEICIPRLSLNDISKDRIKIFLAEYIRSIIPMHILGVLPQLIGLHSPNLASVYKKTDPNYDNSNIETIYGCLADHINPVKDDFHWIEFRYDLPNDYSSNIFEVCQNLT